MGRVFADLIRVDLLDPFHLRSISSQLGKLNGPASSVVHLVPPVNPVYVALLLFTCLLSTQIDIEAASASPRLTWEEGFQ